MKATLGEDNPLTLICWSNVGLLEKNVGNLDLAEKHLRECVRRGEQHTKDPLQSHEDARPWDNLTRKSNLALILKAQGEHDDAARLLHNCMKADTQLLGDRHHYTLCDIHNYGACVFEQGEDFSSEQLLFKAQNMRDEVLGPTHLRSAFSRWWWCVTLVKNGKLKEARKKLVGIISKLKKTYGENHKRPALAQQLLDKIS